MFHVKHHLTKAEDIRIEKQKIARRQGKSHEAI